MKYIGRGIVLRDEKCYEFQTALVNDINNKVKKLKETLKNSKEKKAEKIPVLPDLVTIDLIKETPLKINKIPIGYEINSKQKYFYDFSKNLMVISSEEYD